MQVGNALTDDLHDHLGVFEFMWTTGMISDQTYKQLNLLCDFQSFIHSSEQCDKILDIASEEVGNIDPYSIYTPTCTANFRLSSPLLKRLRVRMGLLNLLNSLFKLLINDYFDLHEFFHAKWKFIALGKLNQIDLHNPSWYEPFQSLCYLLYKKFQLLLKYFNPSFLFHVCQILV